MRRGRGVGAQAWRPLVAGDRVVFCGLRHGGFPPLGVGYLVTALRQDHPELDYQYRELDAGVAALAADTAALEPRVVGLTATSADFGLVRQLVRELRRQCDPIILLGGAHISSVPETLPRDVDAACLGEAEETIVALIDRLRAGNQDRGSLTDLAGTAWWDGGRQPRLNPRRPLCRDLDRLGPPARDIFGPRYFASGYTSLLTSRGCPYRCAFCQVTQEWRTCRYHSADHVVREIAELVSEYQMRRLDLVDDLFIARRGRLVDIIEGLRRTGLLGQVEFGVNGRANLIDDELVELLVQMGVVEVALGLESMSPRVLPTLKDKVTVEDNLRAVDTLHRGGLKAGGLYMVGTPGEGLAELAQTYDYVSANRHKLGGMQLCLTTPLPNTPLWDRCVELGRLRGEVRRLNWRRLNVAAENPWQCLYVGDLPLVTFVEVVRRFRELFFAPGPAPLGTQACFLPGGDCAGALREGLLDGRPVVRARELRVRLAPGAAIDRLGLLVRAAPPAAGGEPLAGATGPLTVRITAAAGDQALLDHRLSLPVGRWTQEELLLDSSLHEPLEVTVTAPTEVAVAVIYLRRPPPLEPVSVTWRQRLAGPAAALYWRLRGAAALDPLRLLHSRWRWRRRTRGAPG